MAKMSRWTAVFSIAWMSSSFLALAAATPTVTFPFNSQVPLVARKNQPYAFQLSSSTFEPEDNLVYTLSGQPAWLSINSATRTLLGTPKEADVGASTFNIVATDGTGNAQMQCTLVIAADPAPQLYGDFSQQLAAEVNLTSNAPATVALTPGTQFSFHFRQDSFIDVVQRKLYYYATLENHTPLPSWLLFDSSSLTFSGTAPQLSAFPQSFEVALIASDYVGFAGAQASFILTIATQRLAVVPSLQTISFNPGSPLNYSLADSVYVDGKQLPASELKSATATLPSWASFDVATLTISSSATQEGAQNGSVVIVDAQGNKAQVTLHFVTGNDTVFVGTIGTIAATAGQELDYAIPTSVIDEVNVDLTLTAPTSAGWLQLDPSARVIHGVVPTGAAGSVIKATLAATPSNTTTAQTQTFEIAVANTTSGPAGTTSTAATAGALTSSSSHLSPGAIAAIVIGSIIGALILLALIFLCCCCCRRRRRRQHDGYVERTPSPTRDLIPGPLVIKHPDTILVTTQVHSDVEKTAEGERAESADEERPPQIALEIPASTRLGARASGYSQASSIGNGEDAIRRDANIPEWGQDSTVLHKPREGFSVPITQTREPRYSRSLSPSKRALLRAQEKARQSVGLGIDARGHSNSPNLAKNSRKSGRIRPKASSAGLSATLDRSSCASLSTQATSLLSTKPSDFPRPPTQSTFSNASRSNPTLSMFDIDPKRRSIRMLKRSDSINDSRPIELRRESFIRARASTSLQSPLFSHGSRNPLEARGRGSSSDVSSTILNRWRSRRQALRSTYSQSSVDQSEADCRRLSQRVRSVFAPNFPRVISDASEYEDANVVADDKDDDEWEDITPAASRHQSTHNVQDLAAEMAKPRHQRSWVLPGEASPTPPPSSARPMSRQVSRGRKTSESEARARWKQRVASNPNRSSSPLSRAIDTGIAEGEEAPAVPRKSPDRRYSYLNEPFGLVSKDSFSRAKGSDRPRLGDTKSNRPVSVEKVERLSSFKAETVDAVGGSEMDEDTQGTGLMGPDYALSAMEGTQKSAMSGTAFL